MFPGFTTPQVGANGITVHVCSGGSGPPVSVAEPEAQAMLLDFDRTAAHRSVVADARG